MHPPGEALLLFFPSRRASMLHLGAEGLPASDRGVYAPGPGTWVLFWSSYRLAIVNLGLLGLWDNVCLRCTCGFRNCKSQLLALQALHCRYASMASCLGASSVMPS